MNKKIYLAMRYVRLGEYKLKIQELKKLGFEISHDWSNQESIQPISEHHDLATKYAEEDIAGVKNADIFILIAEKEKDARGCNAEFGIALANKNKYQKLIVMHESEDDSMFYFAEGVRLVRSWEEVLIELKK